MAVSTSTHISKLIQDPQFRQRIHTFVVGEGKVYEAFPWEDVWPITDEIIPLISHESDVVSAYIEGGGYDHERVDDTTLASKVATFVPLVRPELVKIP